MNSRFIAVPAILCALSLAAQSSKALDIPRPQISPPTINIPRPTINVPRPTINIPRPNISVPHVSAPNKAPVAPKATTPAAAKATTPAAAKATTPTTAKATTPAAAKATTPTAAKATTTAAKAAAAAPSSTPTTSAPPGACNGCIYNDPSGGSAVWKYLGNGTWSLTGINGYQGNATFHLVNGQWYGNLTQPGYTGAVLDNSNGVISAVSGIPTTAPSGNIGNVATPGAPDPWLPGGSTIGRISDYLQNDFVLPTNFLSDVGNIVSGTTQMGVGATIGFTPLGAALVANGADQYAAGVMDQAPLAQQGLENAATSAGLPAGVGDALYVGANVGLGAAGAAGAVGAATESAGAAGAATESAGTAGAATEGAGAAAPQGTIADAGGTAEGASPSAGNTGSAPQSAPAVTADAATGDSAAAIDTPHGPAVQAASPEASAALQDAQSGGTVYRQGTTGVQNTSDAQFWSPNNPATTPGYADKMGMPPAAGQGYPFIQGGTVEPGSPVITRPAPGIGTNAGGNIEVVVPPGGVQTNWFHMPD
jgi:hypothetical protein